VDGETMRQAIAITDWFIAESQRVLAMFGESDEARQDRELVEWISRRPEGATARDVARIINRFRGRGGMERAERQLHRLAEEGRLIPEQRPIGPKGGRGTMVFHAADGCILDPPDGTDTDGTSATNHANSPNDQYGSGLERFLPNGREGVPSVPSAPTAAEEPTSIPGAGQEENENPDAGGFEEGNQ
jgi:hypothetical protein